ncbi:MAG: NAD(P)-dependent oxidoreductase, partial [Candidatus Limnocylindrales bacterium]
DVRGLDRRAASAAAPEHHVVDLLDRASVDAAVEGVSAVVHAAGIPWDLGDPATVMSVNVMGTWNLLQASAAAGVERVVAFSSINAQGSTGGRRAPRYLPLDDDHPHHPTTPYQLSKHLMEEVCRSFSEQDGPSTICLRPVFVAHAASPHVARFGTDASMRQWRDEFWAYVDVRDVCDAVIRSLRVEGVRHDRFLLAALDTSAGEPTRTLVAREHADIPWPKVDQETYLTTDPYRSLVDCRHARDVLGWEARYSWRDASAEAIDQGSEP